MEPALCVPLLDADSGFYPDDAMVKAVAGLSPSPHHLTVRCALSVSKRNTYDLSLIQRALNQWQSRDFTVILVLDNMARSWEQTTGDARLAAMPNAQLGLGGDPFRNAWITEFADTTSTILKGLGGDVPRRVVVANENNLQAREVPGIPALHTGDVPHPSKPSAMGANAACSLYYTVASRIRSDVPAVKLVMPAPVSCLVNFRTDIRSGWAGAWFGIGIDYLKTNGAKWPLPFSGWAVNGEGLCDESFCSYTAGAMRDMMKSWGMTGPIWITEWGYPATPPFDEAQAGAVFQAVHKHFDLASFFQLTSYNNYGIYQLVAKAGRLTVGTPNAWAPLLTSEYAKLRTP